MSNKITVELVDSMGNDLRVANVARVSFNKWKEEFDNSDAKLIDYLATHEHETPFRHCQISVRCEAPIFIARQLGKHQVGFSWNEVSRRYVDIDIELFKQNGWRKRPDDGIKQGSGTEIVTHLNTPRYGDIEINNAVDEYYSRSIFLYELMLENKVAPELARQVLPQSMMTTWVWTGSLVGFYNVYRLRAEAHAQIEAQDFAHKLEKVIEPLFPYCWDALKNS